MDNNDLLSEVLEIASNVFSVSRSDINEDTNQNELEKWDSLGHLNFILNIENKLNVKFHTNDIIRMKSIKDVIDKINK